MTTLHADFNALTEDRSISLTTIGSLSDVEKYGVRPGDWVWLSDGELQVGAEVVEDRRRGLVGRPVWETSVDLEEADPADILALWSEMCLLLDIRRNTPREGHLRLIALLNRFERVAPPSLRDAIPGSFAFQRAISLRELGLDGLSLMESRGARAADPENSTYGFFYFDLLRRLAPDRAMEEVGPLVSTPGAHALLLAAAAHIAIAVALKHPDADFSTGARQALVWCDRFEHARGRDEVPASLLSLVTLDRGFLLLELGEIRGARHAFGLAAEISPGADVVGEVDRLTGFDQSARAIAAALQTRPLAADYRRSLTAA